MIISVIILLLNINSVLFSSRLLIYLTELLFIIFILCNLKYYKILIYIGNYYKILIISFKYYYFKIIIL